MPPEVDPSSAELFRQLVEAAPDAMIVVDAKGVIVLANMQAEHMFGYSREEILGQSLELLLPDRYRARHAGHREAFARDPKARPMGAGLDLRGRRKDGQELEIEISLSPIETAGGRFMAAAIRDISDRKRAEAEARRISSYLESSVDSIGDTFLLFDERDKVVLVNSAARQLFGHSLEGPIEGLGFQQVLEGALDAGVIDQADETPDLVRERWIAYHRDPSGSFDLRTTRGRTLRVTERRTAEGGTVAVIADITEDVDREAELLRARLRAEKANDAKSEFLSSMSHELRTPLNAVLGFAQLLQRDKRSPLDERQKDRLSHVLRGGEHLLRLIDDVLDLSRIETGRVSISTEPVDVSDVLGEVTSTLEPMATRGEIRIEVAPFGESLPLVLADRTRLAQILMNFGSNAIKYGKKGGAMTFLVEPLEGSVRLSVKDDGIGIAERHRAKIFEPFQRAGQETGPIEGTGIGLAISKRLAGLMGGSVGFDTTPGEGSVFWVEVPAQALESERDPTPMRPMRRRAVLDDPANRKLVVYIEDNPANIAFMRDLLGELAGIELLTAPTAEIGLELCRAHRPALVIMDINLPGMSGIEATRRLAAWPETQGTPVVGLSAAVMPRDKQRATEAGFHRYLTKPVKVDELASVLEEILASP